MQIAEKREAFMGYEVYCILVLGDYTKQCNGWFIVLLHKKWKHVAPHNIRHNSYDITFVIS